MTTEEKRLNRYYLRNFGHTLMEVDAIFASHGNVCSLCERLPAIIKKTGKRMRLSLDHDHAWDRAKVRVFCGTNCYIANADGVDGKSYAAYGVTRNKARAELKKMLRRKSVRGAGLCLPCNKGLRFFEDSKAPILPEARLTRAAEYLRRYKNSLTSTEKHDTVGK